MVGLRTIRSKHYTSYRIVTWWTSSVSKLSGSYNNLGHCGKSFRKFHKLENFLEIQKGEKFLKFPLS